MSTNASWQQAAHLLTLVSNKGLPIDQIQRLYSSGLLSDLLDADVGSVNRDEFRKVLGLGPIYRRDRHGRILITVTGCGLTGEEWLARFQATGVKPTRLANDVLMRSDYNDKHRLKPGKQYTVALMFVWEESSNADGFRITADDFRQRAERDYGISEDLCGELVLLLREVISDEELERWGIWYVEVPHQSIIDSYGDPMGLTLSRCDSGYLVDASSGEYNHWGKRGAFAFPIS